MRFQFCGTIIASLGLDPAEFAGKSVSEIAAEIVEMLSAEEPGADFWEDDVVHAANELSELAKEFEETGGEA